MQPKSKVRSITLLVCSILATSCLDPRYVDYQAEEKAPEDVDFLFVSQQILTPSCVRCHNSGRALGGVRLDDEALLLSTDSASAGLLVPGNPDASRLWLSVENDSMPPSSNKLTQDQKDLLRVWISSLSDDRSTDPPDSQSDSTTLDQSRVPQTDSGDRNGGGKRKPPKDRGDQEDDTKDRENPNPVEIKTYKDLAEHYITPFCIQCHGEDHEDFGNFVNLTSYEEMIDGFFILTPCEPEDSGIWYTASATPEPGMMPPEQVSLRPSGELIMNVEKWIRSGAPETKESEGSVSCDSNI